MLHGTSIGGARPKATVERDGTEYIAKFASSSDDRPVEKGEFVAMALARRCGLSVARVELTQASGKDVLLVERFDRPAPGQRRIVVSANTILRLGPFGIGASYCDLADEVRRRFVEPTETLRELFSRIVFNILVGNTDDHARNHAAFWDGAELMLTPAYDLCPQRRSGNVASQAMAIAPSRSKESRLAVCVDAARSFGLTAEEARGLIDRQVDVIRGGWDDVCDAAELTSVERVSMWGRQFLNAYAFEGY